MPTGSGTGAILNASVRALPSGPGPHNTMPLRVTLDDACARPGDTMVARARSDAGAALEFVAAYESSSSPDFVNVPPAANLADTYVWRWRVRTEVPYGRGVLAVRAKKDEKQATFVVWFTVKGSC